MDRIACEELLREGNERFLGHRRYCIADVSLVKASVNGERRKYNPSDTRVDNDAFHRKRLHARDNASGCDRVDIRNKIRKGRVFIDDKHRGRIRYNGSREVKGNPVSGDERTWKRHIIELYDSRSFA